MKRKSVEKDEENPGKPVLSPEEAKGKTKKDDKKRDQVMEGLQNIQNAKKLQKKNKKRRQQEEEAGLKKEQEDDEAN